MQLELFLPNQSNVKHNRSLNTVHLAVAVVHKIPLNCDTTPENDKL